MKSLKKHQIIEKMVSGVIKNLSNSLIITASCGTGKTESILKTLKDYKLKENIHFKFLNNYSSPLEFYNILKSVNDLEKPQLIILDDCEEFLKSQRIVGILRSALWGGIDEKRIIHWHSTSPKVQDQKFEFFGKIIFLMNSLNLQNPLVRALISRGFYYHLELSNQEKIALMKKRAKEPYQDLSERERLKIVNYIEKVGKYSEKLTLRTLSQALALRILSPNHFQTLIRKMLE